MSDAVIYGEPIEEREGTFFDGYRYGLYKAHNIIDKQQKEIERLNTNWNELEKYINEEYIYDELGMKIFDASELQDKLQELKGSEKNEQANKYNATK